MRDFLRNLTRHWGVGAAHQNFDLSAERAFIEAHGLGAVAVKSQVSDRVWHKIFSCKKEVID
jgi:hypothetical protein